MPTAKVALFVLLGIFAAVFGAVWMMEFVRRKNGRFPTDQKTHKPTQDSSGVANMNPYAPPQLHAPPQLRAAFVPEHKTSFIPTTYQILVGFVTNFFDTLGIGSFATTTTLFRLRQTVADEKIPGTLNVGHCIPTLTQAYIYISIVKVELQTLVLLIAASVLGSWLGAGVVARLPRRQIQIGMGSALLVAAALFLRQAVQGDPTGGEALGLEGTLLAVALAGNFIFGALMTIGVGAYAPIMIMVSLLGMNPKTAFPIMMGSCAFLMPVAGIRFIRAGAYDPRAALCLMLGGVPAVLLAAFIVKELSLDVVRWLVIVVVLYTSASMIWTAHVEKRARLAKEAGYG